MKYQLPRGYLSASQISSYLKCGMQYYYRYIEGVSTPPNIAMMTGSACHSGFETYYQDCIDEGKPSVLTGPQVAEIAITSIEEEAEEKDIALVGDVKDQVVTEIQTGITSYIDHVAPKVIPLAVEKEIRFDLAPGLEVLAYIDLVRAASGEVPGGVVCDYKITGKKWALPQLKNSIQFLLYAIGMEMEDVEIHNIRKTTGHVAVVKDKGDAPGWESPSQDITNNIRILRHTFNEEAEKSHIVTLTKSVAENITKGVFMPCAPDAWNCNPTWCGYWGMCRGKCRGKAT